MTRGIDLRLLVFIGRDADTASVADLVGGLVGGLAAPGRPSPDAGAAISVTTGGHEHLGATLSWGPFSTIGRQFDVAAARLERGDVALVRSARMDISAGICLVAEPHRNTVVISLGAVTESPYATWFPDDPAHGEALVDHVTAHRDRVLGAAAHLGMTPARGSRARVVTALRREAMLAAALADDTT